MSHKLSLKCPEPSPDFHHYERHTIDIDRPMRFQLVDAGQPPVRFDSGHLAVAFFVGLSVGYVLGRWVLPHVFGGGGGA